MDDMLTCPYNRSHLVSKLRMAQHLVRCEANNPHIVLSTCYYDFLHRVPPEKLDEHLKICPSKNKFSFRVENPLGEAAETGEKAETAKTAEMAKMPETTETAEMAKTAETARTAKMPETAKTPEMADTADTAETSQATKKIYLKSSTSDYKGSPKHSMQPDSPAKGSSDTMQPATPVKDTSKGAIPKTTRPTYRYRYGSKGPSSSDVQSGGKGRSLSKTRKDSWDTDSSDEAE